MHVTYTIHTTTILRPIKSALPSGPIWTMSQSACRISSSNFEVHCRTSVRLRLVSAHIVMGYGFVRNQIIPLYMSVMVSFSFCFLRLEARKLCSLFEKLHSMFLVIFWYALAFGLLDAIVATHTMVVSLNYILHGAIRLRLAIGTVLSKVCVLPPNRRIVAGRWPVLYI